MLSLIFISFVLEDYRMGSKLVDRADFSNSLTFQQSLSARFTHLSERL